ncbi:TPA: type 1 fimbrial protein [Salmonella enterica]|nr:type 1 fimbrial protein [Salmonella enterica]
MKIIPRIIVTLWGAVIMSAPVMAAFAGVQSYKVNIMAPTCSISVGSVEVKLGNMYKDLIVMGQDPVHNTEFVLTDCPSGVRKVSVYSDFKSDPKHTWWIEGSYGAGSGVHLNTDTGGVPRWETGIPHEFVPESGIVIVPVAFKVESDVSSDGSAAKITAGAIEWNVMFSVSYS